MSATSPIISGNKDNFSFLKFTPEKNPQFQSPPTFAPFAKPSQFPQNSEPVSTHVSNSQVISSQTMPVQNGSTNISSSIPTNIPTTSQITSESQDKINSSEKTSVSTPTSPIIPPSQSVTSTSTSIPTPTSPIIPPFQNSASIPTPTSPIIPPFQNSTPTPIPTPTSTSSVPQAQFLGQMSPPQPLSFSQNIVPSPSFNSSPQQSSIFQFTPSQQSFSNPTMPITPIVPNSSGATMNFNFSNQQQNVSYSNNPYGNSGMFSPMGDMSAPSFGAMPTSSFGAMPTQPFGAMPTPSFGAAMPTSSFGTAMPLFDFGNSFNPGYAPPTNFNFAISSSTGFTGSVPYNFLVDFQQGKTLKKFFNLLTSVNTDTCVLEFHKKGIFCRHTSTTKTVIVEVNFLEYQLYKYKIYGDISENPMIIAVDPGDGIKKCGAGAVGDSLTMQSVAGQERIFLSVNGNQSKATGFNLIKTYEKRGINPINFDNCLRFKTTGKSFKENLKNLKTVVKSLNIYLILYSNCCEIVSKDSHGVPVDCMLIPELEGEEPTEQLKIITLESGHIDVFSKISSIQPNGSVINFSYTREDLIVKISAPADQLGTVDLYLI